MAGRDVIIIPNGREIPYPAALGINAEVADGSVGLTKLDPASITVVGLVETRVSIVPAGNGVGSRTANGLLTGDSIIRVINLATGADITASFELQVTVDNQLQQIGTNLTGVLALVSVSRNSGGNGVLAPL